MAKDKSSFLLYSDLLHTVEKMPQEKAGKLFLIILQYVNDKNPECEDLVVQIAFEPIKQQLKRDLKNWETIKKKRSKAGKISANKKQQNQHVLTCVEGVEHNSTKSTVNVNENVTVNDTVTVINKERDSPAQVYSIEHCLIVAMNDNRWVKANKVTKEKLLQFNGVLEKSGVYTKNPMDYKKHFANWWPLRKEEKEEIQMGGPKLKIL